MTVRHISFATREYTRAARELRSTARRFKLNTYVYTDAHPTVRALAAKHPEIMAEKRGAGCWLWKPAIILDALERSAEGDVVLYTDSAMHVIADPSPMIALAAGNPIVLFEHTSRLENGAPGQPQRHWTKRDCFVLLDADSAEYWDTQQLLGGFQMYRNSPQARDFVRSLLDAMTDPRVLTDHPNTAGRPDFPDFAGHRHDQAVLTIMAQKRGLPRWPDPTQYGQPLPRTVDVVQADGLPRPASNYGQIFHIHRKKDRGAINKFRAFFGIKTGTWRP